jgi:hypothetical protein
MFGWNLANCSGGSELDSRYADIPENHSALAPVDVPAGGSVNVRPEQLTLQDPRAVLSLLEADQVVAAKRRTHFGRKNLTPGTKALLWALRVYVVGMMVIVLIAVYQAIHATH